MLSFRFHEKHPETWWAPLPTYKYGDNPPKVRVITPVTLPKLNIAPEKLPNPNRKVYNLPTIHFDSGYVC